MKIYSETNLPYFEFWSGACDTVSCLTYKDLEQLEFILEDLYPDGISATHLNDMFAYDEDWIASLLGYSSFEELQNDREEL